MNILNLTKGLLTIRQIADLCGITVQAVYKWEKSERGIPAEYCRAIEQATNGAVTRYDLRPDVFGASAAGEPSAVKEEIAPSRNRRTSPRRTKATRRASTDRTPKPTDEAA